MAEQNCITKPAVSILQTSSTTECNTDIISGKTIMTFLVLLGFYHITLHQFVNNYEKKELYLLDFSF